VTAVVWKPHVTVAAVGEREGRFLMVEESVNGHLVLNQPAGHLDDGESLQSAVIREAHEETAWEFEAQSLLGLYLWKSPGDGDSFLRAAFAGRWRRALAARPPDPGIQRVLWLTREEIAAAGAGLRSPLVLRCVDDYLGGRRYPLDLLQQITG
jgi:ADP-ribose pyrophosphatase YjhB (NUDIX family)